MNNISHMKWYLFVPHRAISLYKGMLEASSIVILLANWCSIVSDTQYILQGEVASRLDADQEV
jgi:hypothetical protein